METKRENKDQKRKREYVRKETDSSSSSDSSSSGDEKMEWTEKTDSPKSSTLNQKRDEWMDSDFFVPTFSNESRRERANDRKIKSMEQELHNQKLLKERELNPYLKGKSDTSDSQSSPSSAQPPFTKHVNDGGYSWLKKAYQRVKEQAKEEGRSMEDVASERWGSLAKLESMLEDAKRHSGIGDYDDDRAGSRRESGKYRHGYSDRYRHSERDTRNREQMDKKKAYMRPDEDHASHRTGSDDYGRRDRRDETRISSKRNYEERSDDRNKRSTNKTSVPAWKKRDFVKEEESKIVEKSSLEVSDALISEKRERSATPEVSVEEKPVESDEADSDSRERASDHEADEKLVLNSNEMNYLGARLLAAEIYKDDKLLDKLERLFNAEKEAFEESVDQSRDGEIRDYVLQRKIDRYPLPKPLQRLYGGKQLASSKKVYVGNFRTRNFDSGDETSLQHMFEKEKWTTADDNLKMFVDVASVSKTPIDEDNDGVLSKKAQKKLSKPANQEKDKQKAISEYKQLSRTMEKCPFCIDQPTLPRHTIAGKGSQVLLCVPQCESLVDGHCFIVPVSHVPSTLHLGEDEYSEIEAFKRGLVKMFGDRKDTVVFLELSLNHRWHPHAVIECIPMPGETGDMAPLYFKKAIEESEYEWSHNKKLVDTSKKGLRHSVPKGFPFFSVEFGLDGGFAHVIEDEKSFPRHFGKEIVGGMLEIDSHVIMNQRKEPAMAVCKKTLKMVNQWWKYKDYFTP